MILHESEGVTVLEPMHDLHEGSACDQLDATLARLAEHGDRVIIDVTHVRHITARCLGILVNSQRVAAEHGGRIALCGTTGVQQWVIEKTGLIDVIPVYDDVASALRHLATPAVA